MRDFNTVKNDLINSLQMSFRTEDGRTFWYAGTIETMWEFITVAFFQKKAEEDE